jgi:hypothetical protein
MIAALAAIALAALRCAPSPPPTSIELASPDGTRTLTLAATGITLGVGGKRRATFGETPSGGFGVVLLDAEETRRAVLALSTRGGPRLTLGDADGTRRVVLDVRSDGGAHLAFFDAAGGQRMAVIAEADGSPAVGLFDGAGTQRAALGGSADGAVGIALFGPDGGERGLFNLEPDGRPGLVLYDDTGRERVVLEVTAAGNPHLELFEGAEPAIPEEEPDAPLGPEEGEQPLESQARAARAACSPPPENVARPVATRSRDSGPAAIGGRLARRR